MNYTYTVDTLLPKSEFMSVTYSAAGFPDYRRNFNPTSFTDSDLRGLITGFAPHVVHFWERQDSYPDSYTLSGGSGSAEAPIPYTFDPDYVVPIDSEPYYDPFTQILTLDDLDSPMQPSRGWTITDMTDSEQADYLTDWRATFAVTMPQFRLALHQSGILDSVASEANDSINNQILWGTAFGVRRSSPFVERVLTDLLGLSADSIDDYFLAADELSLLL